MESRCGVSITKYTIKCVHPFNTQDPIARSFNHSFACHLVGMLNSNIWKFVVIRSCD
jgi:hypothetical protein